MIQEYVIQIIKHILYRLYFCYETIFLIFNLNLDDILEYGACEIMWIDTDLLLTWGAVAKKHDKNEFIFREGEESRFYFQIIEGRVKMCCFNEEGREFWQGDFCKGESFGEPPLFANERYPANAITETGSIIIKISKITLFKLLDEYPDLRKEVIYTLAKRLVMKATLMKELFSQHPRIRILSFLQRYKKEHLRPTPTPTQLIPYTRQDIANFTGLRVETVIRTIKLLDKEGLVMIKNRKLYY